MNPEPDGRPMRGPMTKLFFVSSAAGVAVALRLAWEEPALGIALIAIIGLVFVLRAVSRARVRRVLRSGDIESILARWSTMAHGAPHPETMKPLMTATAFAAYGWVDRARAELDRARHGPAWEAALEHRMFLDALLLIFEGEVDAALDKARALEQLPLPLATPSLADRVHTMRAAVGALARAFAHQPRSGDRRLLLEAGDASPLVHWAMRYGAAILSIDAGELGRARALLLDAPEWPGESCFAGFHREITRELERRETEPRSGPAD